MGDSARYYPSRAPGNITIRFERSGGYEGTGLPLPDSGNTIVLPRAYVYAVSGYQRTPGLRLASNTTPIVTYPSLPDAVVTTWDASLLIASPNGEPFMLAGKSNDFPGDADPSKYGGQARRDVISVSLTHAANRTARNNRQKLRSDRIKGQLTAGASQTVEFGLTRIGVAGGETFYFNPDDDRKFMWISCPRESQPGYWCQYYIVLNDRYVAQAVFIDFRFAGGREFLERRVGAVKKALCPYVKCD